MGGPPRKQNDMKYLPQTEIQRAVALALQEDVGPGDVTTLSVVPPETQARALMVAREPITVAGLALAEAAFQSVKVEHLTQDGDQVVAGAPLIRVSGSARAILTGERVALNFVQRLSGIATMTARFVERVTGTPAKILDTRKTTPGLRVLEKYAVTCGGGTNHRFGLFDMVLIKDNHLAALGGTQPNRIAAAVRRAREQYPDLKIEVEADSIEQAEQAAEAGADIVLLDNMTPAQLGTAVKALRGHVKTEASGGVNLEIVRAIAESGVDFISVGAITHSARAVDIGLDFE